MRITTALLTFACFSAVRAVPAAYYGHTPCDSPSPTFGGTGPIFTETSTEPGTDETTTVGPGCTLTITVTETVYPESETTDHETTTRFQGPGPSFTDLETSTTLTESVTETLTITETISECETSSRNQATFPPFMDSETVSASDLPTATDLPTDIPTTTDDDFCPEETTTRFGNPGPSFSDTTTGVETTFSDTSLPTEVDTTTTATSLPTDEETTSIEETTTGFGGPGPSFTDTDVETTATYTTTKGGYGYAY